MRPRQKNCGDKTRRWKGGVATCKAFAQQRLGILQSMQNNWIQNFPCHEKMSGKPKKNSGVFIFFGLGELWLQKIGPSSPQEFMTFWRSEAKRPKAVQVRRFWNNANNEILPHDLLRFYLILFLQKHWIYSDEFLVIWSVFRNVSLSGTCLPVSAADLFAPPCELRVRCKSQSWNWQPPPRCNRTWLNRFPSLSVKRIRGRLPLGYNIINMLMFFFFLGG